MSQAESLFAAFSSAVDGLTGRNAPLCPVAPEPNCVSLLSLASGAAGADPCSASVGSAGGLQGVGAEPPSAAGAARDCSNRVLGANRLPLVLGILCAVAAALVLMPTSSRAAQIYKFETTFNASDAPAGTVHPFQETDGVAVDNSGTASDGTVWVSDYAASVIDSFNPKGEFLSQLNGAETTEGTLNGPYGLAVDQSDGDLYVANFNTGTINKFNAAGKVVKAFAHEGSLEGLGGATTAVAVDPLTGNLYVGTCNEGGLIKAFTSEGKPLAGAPQFPLVGCVQMLAADSQGNIFATNGGEVLVYKISTGELNNAYGKGSGVLTFGGALGIDVDPATNDVFVGNETEISQFSKTGALISTFGKGTVSGVYGLGVGDTKAALYVADRFVPNVSLFQKVIVPDATTLPVTNVGPTSATLHGHVDPVGAGNISECKFEYVPDYLYVESGFSKATTATCLSESSSSPPPYPTATDVSLSVSGLDSNRAYHYRLFAANANGPTHSEPLAFTTPGPPTIDSFSSAHVTETTAELTAKINPGELETKFYFEYGTTTAYGNVAPIPAGAIAASHDEELVGVQLAGLEAGVTYHFRVIAENAEGSETSFDQTFGFSPPSCPNSTVRQQTGSTNVPDCRAYELVTPGNSGNAIIFPAGATANSGVATAPSRLAYGTWGGIVPGSGSVPNTMGDMYVATRTDQGWVSKYVGLPATQAYLMGGPPWRGAPYEPDKWQQNVLTNPSMSEIVDWNDGQYTGSSPQYGGEPNPPGSSNAPYVWNSTSGVLTERWPTGVSGVPGGEHFLGVTVASADLSHFVFSSNVPFPVAEGEAARAVPGAVYDNDTISGKVSVVSVDSNGSNLSEGVPVNASANGSRILISTPAPGSPGCTPETYTQLNPPPRPSICHLYMRVNDSATYDIAPGHVVSYVGATSDSSKVFVTSDEQLTSEDHDSSTDLYMWSAAAAEAGDQPLTLISKGETDIAGQPGNTDNCEPARYINASGNEVSWTSQCSVASISFEEESKLQGGLGGNGYSDSAIASENGDIYFLSPEQLVGGQGIPNQPNLYLYRNSELQFVTTLTPGFACGYNTNQVACSKSPILRMDVSPDDSHMAFISNSRLTSYDNGDPFGSCGRNSVGQSTANSRCTEMYSYVPSTGKITCDSCIPNGEPPTSEVYGSQNGLFMTNDGRTFFSTEDALVPQDTNQGEDVYEFVDGRPQLITGGTGATAGGAEGFIGSQTLGGLVGVSANGTDAYFATAEVLVRQDENGEEIKIYDARTGGGFLSLPPVPPCSSGDECHGPGAASPAAVAVGTGAALGVGGNVRPDHKRHHKRHHKTHKHRRAGSRHHSSSSRHRRSHS